ncbi:MAG: hypothetical protein ACLU9S_06335 [Oscillospiraceae bacterium]
MCRTLGWSVSFLIAGAGSLERLEAYRQGRCYVQDAASRLAVRCAGVQPGMRVLDSCAAPGGKSFAAAMDMGGQGRLISCDIHRHKLTLIQQGRPGWAFLHCNPARRMPGSRFRSGKTPWTGCWWIAPVQLAWASSERSRTSGTRTWPGRRRFPGCSWRF